MFLTFTTLEDTILCLGMQWKEYSIIQLPSAFTMPITVIHWNTPISLHKLIGHLTYRTKQLSIAEKKRRKRKKKNTRYPQKMKMQESTNSLICTIKHLETLFKTTPSTIPSECKQYLVKDEIAYTTRSQQVQGNNLVQQLRANILMVFIVWKVYRHFCCYKLQPSVCNLIEKHPVTMTGRIQVNQLSSRPNSIALEIQGKAIMLAHALLQRNAKQGHAGRHGSPKARILGWSLY